MKNIMIAFVLLILISGCNTSTNNDEQSRGGYADGLKITFLSPTSTDIWEGRSFPVKIKLENYADCDVSGELCVRDLLGEGFGGLRDSCQGFSIRKNYQNMPYMVFTGEPYENLERDISTSIEAQAKYHCSITIDPLICIRDDSEETKKMCDDIETVSGKYPGLKTAPVTVTKVEKDFDPYTGTLRLDIYLDDMNGEIIGDTNNEYEEQGFPVSLEYGSYGALDCSNIEDGIYYWKSDTENIIKCEISLSSINDVEENFLKINLDYMYSIKESKSIMIRHNKNS